MEFVNPQKNQTHPILLMNDRQREKISLMSDKKYIFAITKQNTTLSLVSHKRACTTEWVEVPSWEFPSHIQVRIWIWRARHLQKFFLVTNWIFLCFLRRTTKRHSDGWQVHSTLTT